MTLSISSFFSTISPKLRRILTLRFDKSPVETVESLVEFVHTRSAYVAQTSLYGYLKTRMGTRYPSMFEDEVFARSISIAKWNVFAVCLSDLTVFAIALTTGSARLSDAQAAALARHCYERAIAATFDEAPDELAGLADDAQAAFSVRADSVKWDAAAEGENAFSLSPRALVKWAPIADELKQYDEEIVSNSIRFRWRDVRQQLRQRLNGAAVAADWQGHAMAEEEHGS